MRPGGEKHLGGVGVIGGAAVAPGAAMDEDEDRGAVALAAVDVEPLDRGAAIGDVLRRRQAGAGGPAVGDAAGDQLLAVGGIGGLVVGGVERGLVVIEKD